MATANTSQQELTANVQALNTQVAPISTAFDEAFKSIRDFEAKTEGAWTTLGEHISNNDVTIAEVETKVESLKSNGNSGETRQMRLIDDKSITSPLFSGDRKTDLFWARSVNAYLDSRYSGFHKMFNWAERE